MEVSASRAGDVWRPSGLLAALKACRDLSKGRLLHAAAVESGYQGNTYVANSLVCMYAKCGCMASARRVFDHLSNPNVVSWTSIMFGYAESGQGQRSLDLFVHMHAAGHVADAQAFVAALKGCAGSAATGKAEALQRGMCIHSQTVAAGLAHSNRFVSSSLVDMYAKCGDSAAARRVFDAMPEPDVVSWNALLMGYADSGQAEAALQLYAAMPCCDSRTYAAAFKACAAVSALQLGRAIHCSMANDSKVTMDAVLAASLVDLYAKCGCMVDAKHAFDSMPGSARDAVTWTALMAGYGSHGDAARVLDLFGAMGDAGLKPDGVTLLCVLTACSHAGQVHAARHVFGAICPKYGVQPGLKHYACMVDLLARANQLQDAVAMIQTMPFKPDRVTWMTLLASAAA